MKEDWFKTKFINPRTVDGEPQTQRLEYAREFFESLGIQDERFSGAVMVGSTMKGCGREENLYYKGSDIDIILFYYEEPKKVWEPKRERFPGTIEPAGWVKVWTFNHDYFKFKKEFESKKEKIGKEYFEIDTRPGEYNLAKIKISQKNILEYEKHYAEIFYELSYPIIETKNSHALMPIGKVLEELKKIIIKLNKEQKEQLLKKILDLAELNFTYEATKHHQKTSLNIDKEEYIKTRLQMFKNQLRRKFDLE